MTPQQDKAARLLADGVSITKTAKQVGVPPSVEKSEEMQREARLALQKDFAYWAGLK